MNSYELSRAYWNWAFDNPDLTTPYHASIYFFAVEHCNRLGWKEKFGFPTTMVMEANGIKSYRKYKSVFDDLVCYGFFKVIEYSKNQYSANIISISAYDQQDKALDKALDKAMIKHVTKQSESISESNSSIDKPKTLNNKPKNIEQEKIPAYDDFKEYALENKPSVCLDALKLKYDSWVQNDWKNGNDKEIKNWKSSLLHTLPYIKEKSSAKKENINGSVYQIDEKQSEQIKKDFMDSVIRY